MLIVVLSSTSNHIYWYGTTTTDTTVDSAKGKLNAALWTFLIFLAFEFLILFTGMALMFRELVFLQNFLHLLGCLFSAWFILDSWQY